MVEEAVVGVQKSAAIQFVRGSWPERIKGFNRFGMTQEIVREENGVIRESGYLSFMTSSPEKNSDQGWKAFTDRPQQPHISPWRAASLPPSGYRWALERQSLPADATWMDCPALMERFRGRDVALEEPRRPQAFAERGERVIPHSSLRFGKASCGATPCRKPLYLHP